MKNYTITVNGQTYVVQVEEGITAGAQAAPVVTIPAPAPAAPAGAAGSVSVESPMPGKILSIDKKVGDKVDEGQTIMILEAMKMENEIVAPEAGTIASINVSVGQAVEAGEVLATLG